jgi:sigma-B regulation protein RsbU (phosphoserine phosphatase)
MPPGAKARDFISTYTKDLNAEDLGKLFTRETPEAYRFFARGVNTAELEGLPWHRRALSYLHAFFMAFTMRLSPARRAIYGVALLASVIGLFELFQGIGILSFRLPIALFFVRFGVPGPLFPDGTLWLLTGFLLLHLLVLLEVADRLSLKRDLEVAREIQSAMLPEGTWSGHNVEAFGLTQPANTVGGDFYDILPQPDGTVLVALGDVAGKASPAALLMALLLAILRTLVDEGLPLPALVKRLNLQVARHAPASRFITLFLASYTPATGRLEFVNAGQTPPLLRRQDGTIERLMSGGIALGMFEGSEYEAGEVQLNPGDALLMYSDGLTEAESPDGTPFDEAGLERTLALYAGAYQQSAAGDLGRAVFDAVERHRRDQRLADDLTVLVLSRLAIPIA